MKQRGLTLIELLAGLAMLAVITTLAAPSFSSLVEAQRRQDTAQQLASTLRLARVEAILRSEPVIMQALEGDWSRGWQVFVDTNQNQSRDDDEVILAERSGHRNMRVAGNSKVLARIGFDSSGRVLNTANGTLAVCMKHSAASHYQVAVAVTGRVSLRREGFSTEPCA